MENNSKSPLLSIIIPCYNSAKFIDRTINMLYNQGMKSFELILVDDGSKDNTLDILLSYEKKDEVKVIHQENQGVSVARNKGLSIARGRYVYFLDSDDELTEGTITFFREVLDLHSSCKIFTFGYEMRENGKLKKKYVYHDFNDIEWYGSELMQNFFIKKICINICACIFERNFLLNADLHFKSGMRIGEDVLFINQAMLQDNIKVYSSSRVCFIYQLRSDSATQAYHSFSKEQYLAIRIIKEYLNEYCIRNTKMQPFINFFMCYIYLSSLYYYLRSNVCNKQINTWFSEDGYLRFRSYPFITLRLNTLMFLSRFIPISILLFFYKREKSDCKTVNISKRRIN